MTENTAELPLLADRFGQPLQLRSPLFSTAFKPLRSGRRAEVCMVIRRPNGCLLTARKRYYPVGITRLLTGGIEHGEGIEAALRREVYEETNLTVNISRFLAVVAYVTTAEPDVPVFVSYAFLLDEISGPLQNNDADEQLDAFAEVSPAELPLIAERLEALGDDYDHTIAGSWRTWGAFRSPLHRVVGKALLNGT